MTHLAQVERSHNNFLQGSKLCLIAEKLPSKLWKSVSPTPERWVSLPRQYHHLNEGVLVMVDLNSKREIISVTSATSELVAVLSDWTKRVLEHNSETTKIQEWKDSLSLQTSELSRQKDRFQQEKDLFEIEKSRYCKMVESMRSRLDILEAENELLKKG